MNDKHFEIVDFAKELFPGSHGVTSRLPESASSEDYNPAQPQRQDVKWIGTLTLAQWVIKMVENNRTDEKEFQAALSFYGRPKFEAIWKLHKQSKAGK